MAFTPPHFSQIYGSLTSLVFLGMIYKKPLEYINLKVFPSKLGKYLNKTYLNSVIMRIVETYSHLNGLEFLMVRKPELYQEIINTIKSINAEQLRTKISKEGRKNGMSLFSPIAINKALKEAFAKNNWNESRYSYYVTTDRKIMTKIMDMPLEQQKQVLIENNKEPIYSYNQTDFVKDKVAVEVQFGKYSFVAYDLFVKHMMFFTCGVIDVGIEILPMKEMQKEMSSGIAYFEGEVYNLLRQGRGSPPVPLLIIGVAP